VRILLNAIPKPDDPGWAVRGTYLLLAAQLFFLHKDAKAMLNRTEFLLVAIGVTSGTILPLVVWTAFSGKPPLPKVAPPVSINISRAQLVHESSRIAGNGTATYVLVEFMDYQCPPCKSTHGRLPSMLEKVGSEKVDVVIRNFPLKFHKQAEFAAIASVAVSEQGNLPAFHDALMKSTNLGPEKIRDLAKSVGTNMAKFELSCSGTAKKRVQEDIKLGKRVQIGGTPAFYLCMPDGKVMKLANLGQLPDLVR
jgi:protein-disulfide isomerase